jgi:large subunit ribosomal protein L21
MFPASGRFRGGTYKMFAIIKSGGKQYTVKPGDTLKVDRLNAEENSTIEISDVLAVSDNGQLNVGAPFVSGAVVKATVVEHSKGDKILVFKRTRRKDYKKRYGHRSALTSIKIEDIKVG